MKTPIKVRNLSKSYTVNKKTGRVIKDTLFPDKSKIEAVKDISFTVEKGESVAFLGPNGAGKTTTTKMLTGLIYPTDGEINILGFYPFDRQKEFLTRIGLVMGNKAGLNWDLTPNQSFELLRQIYNIDKDHFESRVTELTKLLDTTELLDTQVRKLSLGERMKMELIGAILHDPEILFLDEPTIGLDIVSKQKIREFLRQIQKEYGTTIILTSHDMDDIEKVCDRVIVINKGELVYDDSMKSLLDKYSTSRFVKFTLKSKIKDTKIREEAKQKSKILESGANFITVEVPKEEMPKLISEVSNKYELDDIDIVSVPLEEIIKDIFEG